MTIKRRFKGSERISKLDSFIRDILKLIERRIIEADFVDLPRMEARACVLNQVLNLGYFNEDITISALRKHVVQDIIDLEKELYSCKNEIRKLKKYIVNCNENSCTNIPINAPPEVREMSEIVRIAVENADHEISTYKDRIKRARTEKKVMSTLLQLICDPNKFIRKI